MIHGLFQRIGDAVASSPDPSERLDLLARAVGTSLGLSATVILSLDGEAVRGEARYFRDEEFRAALSQVHSEEPLELKESPGLQAMLNKEVVTVAGDAPALPARFRACLPAGAWTQWTPIESDSASSSLLVLMGVSPKAEPPDPGLAKTVARLLGGAIRSAKDYDEARRQRDRLTALADSSSLLAGAGPFDDRLRQVAERVGQATGLAGVTIVTHDPSGRQPILTSTYAPRGDFLVRDWEHQLARQPAAFREGLKSSFTTLRQPVVIDNPADNEAVQPFLRDIYQRGKIRSMLALPLRSGSESVGIMSVLSTEVGAFDSDTMSLFEAIAGQVAGGTHVALLLQDVRNALESSREAHLDAMLRLAAVAEAKDPSTGSHLHRIRTYTEAIATRIGWSSLRVRDLGNAAVVHDIGKLLIPDTILTKPGPLTEDEWVVIRKHPTFGEELLANNEHYRIAREVARSHHEHWDGSGYPDGLQGDQIPDEVRIVTLADVFDALLSKRPYKEAWPLERAISHVRREEGRHFAPEVVDAFLALVTDGVIEQLAGTNAAAFPPLPPFDDRLVA